MRMNNSGTGETNTLRGGMNKWPIATFFYGIGVGAALMYFLDPRLGSRRRAYIGQQVKGKLNDLESTAGSKVRDLGNRARGVVAEVRSALTEGREVNEPAAERSEREMAEDSGEGGRPQAA